jgi:peroxiredoxin
MKQNIKAQIGSLLYFVICTSLDTLFAISKAARKSKNPTLEDWVNVLKIFRYIKYTKNYGIGIQKGIDLKFLLMRTMLEITVQENQHLDF